MVCGWYTVHVHTCTAAVCVLSYVIIYRGVILDLLYPVYTVTTMNITGMYNAVCVCV